MAVRSETVAYEANGLAMVSQFYVDDSTTGPRPGILVYPEAFGLGEHAKSRAERLAGLGYAALACDLHGQGRMVSSLEEVMGLIGPMMQNPSGTRARAQGGLAAL